MKLRKGVQLLLLATIANVGVDVSVAHAEVNFDVMVGAPSYEPVRGESVWVPGYWRGFENGWVWEEGHWELERPGYYYGPPHGDEYREHWHGRHHRHHEDNEDDDEP